MTRLIFLLALASVAYIIYKMYLKNLRKPNKQEMIKYGLVAGGLLFIVMAVTGRASMIFAAIGAVMTAALRYYPLIIRHWPQIRRLYRRYGGAAAAGQTSRVTTAVLVMSLDHDSGRMDGEITDGTYSGKHLSELSTEELKAFYRFCQSRDAQAVQILEAYIQRERLDEWQDQPCSDYSQAENHAGTLKADEAWEILGLEAGASRKEIIEAHRRLMSRLHPDKGGSNYLAAKINEARNILLDKVS